MEKEISAVLGEQIATKGPTIDAGPQPCKVEANKSKKQITNQ
jgi:hypothetical protein